MGLLLKAFWFQILNFKPPITTSEAQRALATGFGRTERAHLKSAFKNLENLKSNYDEELDILNGDEDRRSVVYTGEPIDFDDIQFNMANLSFEDELDTGIDPLTILDDQDIDDLERYVRVVCMGGTIPFRYNLLRGFCTRRVARFIHNMEFLPHDTEPIDSHSEVALQVRKFMNERFWFVPKRTPSKHVSRPMRRIELTAPLSYAAAELGEYRLTRIPPVPYAENSMDPCQKRRFLASRAHQLDVQLLRKTQCVVANEPARILMSGHWSASGRALKQLVASARVYVRDYKSIERPLPRIRLAEYFPSDTKSLTVLNQRFESFRLLSDHRSVFGAQGKMALKWARCYFEGEQAPEPKVIESMLTTALLKRMSMSQALAYDWTLPFHNRKVVTIQGQSLGKSKASTRARNAYFLAKQATEDFIDTESLERVAFNFVAFLTAFFSQTTALGAVSTLIQQLSSYPSLWSRARTSLGAYYNELAAVVKTVQIQGATDWAPEVLKQVNSHLYEVAYGMMTSVKSGITEQLLPEFSRYVSQIKFEFIRQTTKELAESIIFGMKNFFNTLKSCYHLGSFRPLLGNEYDPLRWASMADVYETNFQCLTSNAAVHTASRKKLIDNGVLDSSWEAAPDSHRYIAILDEHLALGARIKQLYSTNRDMSRAMTEGLTSFSRFVSVQRRSIIGSTLRQQPFGIMLLGRPNTGKSNLSNIIKNAIGRKYGKDISSAGTYTHKVGANFKDGLTARCWHYAFDDADQITPIATEENYITDIINIINNAPYQVEGAAISDKGVNYLYADLVTWTGNNGTCKIHSTGAVPEAFFRRFPLRVFVTFKSSVVGPDGKLKLECAQMTHDIYELEVWKYDANEVDMENDQKLPYTFYKRMPLAEFLQLTFQMYEEHMNRQIAVLESNALPEGKVCAKCWCEISRKSCACVGGRILYPINPDQNTLTPEKIRENVFPKSQYVEQATPVVSEGVPAETENLEKQGRPWFSRKRRVKLTSNPTDLEEEEPTLPPNQPGEEKANESDEEEDFYQETPQIHFRFPPPPRPRPDCCTQLGVISSLYYTMLIEGPYALQIAFLKELVTSKLFLGLIAAVLVAWIAASYASPFRTSTKTPKEGDLGEKVTVQAGSDPQTWIRAAQNYTASIPFRPVTWSKEELVTNVHSSTVIVEGPHYAAFGLVVANNLVLIPTHLLSKVRVDALTTTIDLSQSITLRWNGFSKSHLIQDLQMTRLSSTPELTLIKVTEIRGRDLTRFMFVERDTTLSSVEQVEIHSHKCLTTSSKNFFARSSGQNILRTVGKTSSGDCGASYLGLTKAGWRIMAIHWAGDSEAITHGLVVCANDIRVAAERLSMRVQGVELFEESVYSNPPSAVEHFPPKSELSVAYTAGYELVPFGSVDPPIAFQSMKTCVKHSLFSEELLQYQEEMTGTPLPSRHWQLPNFKGAMDDVTKTWKSSVTEALSHSKSKDLDPDLVLLAIHDYIDGMVQLDSGPARNISLEEAVTGVPELFIQPLDLTTSMGPPFNKPKSGFIQRTEEGVFLDKRISEGCAKVESSLADRIVSVCSVWCMKDEPVAIKAGTIHGQKLPRIFNNVSGIFNLTLRQVLAGSLSFIRRNKYFFETAIGTDMTSHECQDVVDYLKRWNPELDSIIEEDVVAMDKSWIGEHFNAVAKVFYAIATRLGQDAVKTENAILSIGNCLHAFKSEVFMCSHLPSGVLVTVEMNSVNLSLAHRYAYYYDLKQQLGESFYDRFPRLKLDSYARTFYSDPLQRVFDTDFRLNVGLISYGDDSLRVGKPLSAGAMSAWGLVFQAASDKSKSGVLGTITDVSFLKRTFVFYPELGRYVAKLSTKSMFRTLVMRKKSILSENDHAAVSVSEFLREAVYHGRDFYEKWFNRLVPLFEQRGVVSAYLRVASYDFWFEQMLNKEFRSWIIWDAPDLINMDSDLKSVNPVIRQGRGKPLPPRPSTVPPPLPPMPPSATTVITSTHRRVSHSKSLPTIKPQLRIQTSDEQLMEFEVSPDEFEVCIERLQIQGSEVPKTQIVDSISGIISESPMVSSGDTSLAPAAPLVEHNPNEILMRASLISSITLSTTNTQFQQWSFDPHDLFFASPIVYDIMDNYLMWRGTLRLSFTTSVAALMGGRYTVSLFPRGYQYSDTTGHLTTNNTLNPTNASQMDYFVELDMSASTNGYIDIPYFFHTYYCPTKRGVAPATIGVNCWTVFLTCICPLIGGVANTASSGQIRFFANFIDDLELVAPEFHDIIPTLQAGEEPPQEVQGKLSGATIQPTVGSGIGLLQNAFKRCFQKPSISNTLAIMGDTANGFSHIASALGFTRVTKEILPGIFLGSTPEVTTSDGDDHSRPVSYTKGCAITADPRLVGVNGEVDVCSFQDLARRQVIVKTFTWADSQTVGAILARINVCPLATNGTGSTFSPTTLGYVGVPFSHWTGDMWYRVVMNCSPVHRGSIQVFWAPTHRDYSLVDITNILMNQVIDVSANTEFTFRVGYNNLQPYLRNYHNSNPDTTVHNGFIYFKIMNPLRAAVATTITAVVYSWCGENVQFQGARPTYSTGTQYDIDRLTIQGGAVGDAPQVTLSFDLVPGGTILPPEVGYGEIIASVRAMMQKPSRLFGGGTTGAVTYVPFQHGGPPITGTPPVSGITNYPAQRFTFQKYYSCMFAGVAVSDKVKVLTKNNCSAMCFLAFDDLLKLPELHARELSEAGQGFDVHFPYYSPMLFQDPNLDYRAIPPRGHHMDVLQLAGAAANYCQIYLSYGPDLRVARFKQTPYLSANAVRAGTNSMWQTPVADQAAFAAVSSLDETISIGKALALNPLSEFEEEEEEENPAEDDRYPNDDPRINSDQVVARRPSLGRKSLLPSFRPRPKSAV